MCVSLAITKKMVSICIWLAIAYGWVNQWMLMVEDQE